MRLFLLAGLALTSIAAAQLPVHPGPRWASREILRGALKDYENRPKLSGNTYLFTRLGDEVGPGVEPRTLLTFSRDSIVERGVGVHDQWPIEYVNRSEFTVEGLKMLHASGGAAIGFFPKETLLTFDLGGNQFLKFGEVLLREISDAEWKSAEERFPDDLRFSVYGSLGAGDERLVLSMNGEGVVGFMRRLEGAEVERFEGYIHELDRLRLNEDKQRAHSDSPASALTLGQSAESRLLELIYHGEFQEVYKALEPREGFRSFLGAIKFQTALDQLFLNYHDTFSHKYWVHEDTREMYGPWLVAGLKPGDDPHATVAYQVSPPFQAAYQPAYIQASRGKVGTFKGYETSVAPTYVNSYAEFFAQHGNELMTLGLLQENLLRLVEKRDPLKISQPRAGLTPASVYLPWEKKSSREVRDAQGGIAYVIPASCEVGWIQDHGEQTVRLLVGEFAAFRPYAVEIEAVRVTSVLRNPMAVFNRFLSRRGHETGMFIEDTDAVDIVIGGHDAHLMEIDEVIVVVVPREDDHWILTLNRWKHGKGPYEKIFREFLTSVAFDPVASEEEEAEVSVAEYQRDTSTHTSDFEAFVQKGLDFASRRELRAAETWLRKAATLEVEDPELPLAVFLLGLEGGLTTEKAENTRKRATPVRVSDLYKALGLSADIENVIPTQAYVFRDFLQGRDMREEATYLLRDLCEQGSENAKEILERAGIPLEETVEEAPPSQASLNAKTENPVELYQALNEGVDAPVPALFRSESGLAYICGKDASGAYRLEQIPYKRIADAVAEFLAENPSYPAAQYVPFYKGQYAGLAFALETFPHEFSTIEDVTEAARKAPLKSAWAPYGPVNKGRTNARLEEDVILAAALKHAPNRERPLFFKKRDSTRRIYLAHHHELQGGQQYVLVHELHHDDLLEHLDMVEATIAASGSFWGKSADEQLAIILNNNDAASIALERWPDLYPSLRDLLEVAAESEVRKEFFR